MRALLALLLAVVFALPAKGQGGPSYEVTVNSANRLEIRFHGLAVHSVQADDNQNALALNFLQPVDGALFDRLARELPLWIAMAYANFDNGVIRSNRAVSFLVRGEEGGFVLRVIPRGRATESSLARTDPAPIRGSYTGL
jgi:hypothetical protein